MVKILCKLMFFQVMRRSEVVEEISQYQRMSKRASIMYLSCLLILFLTFCGSYFLLQGLKRVQHLLPCPNNSLQPLQERLKSIV